ncbi:MAG: hypothetical protein RO257_04910 [Candidatus Kapabacteria bacterium]|nr:hypothetical protein [Candidatus Kapabacteria bacterium]
MKNDSTKTKIIEKVITGKQAGTKESCNEMSCYNSLYILCEIE